MRERSEELGEGSERGLGNGDVVAVPGRRIDKQEMTVQ